MANSNHHTRQILQHIPITKPQNTKPLALKPNRACSIPLQSTRHRVVIAIDLQYQPRRELSEIDEIISDWDLLAKVKTTIVENTQLAPQLSLRHGFGSSQLPRERYFVQSHVVRSERI